MRKSSKILKTFLQKVGKYALLAYFSTNLTTYALIFYAFGRKSQILWKIWKNSQIFWWKFYRKLIFFIFFENFLLKIEPWEITQFFYTNFFGFGGIPPFPLATPLGRSGTFRRSPTHLSRCCFLVVYPKWWRNGEVKAKVFCSLLELAWWAWVCTGHAKMIIGNRNEK